MAIKKIFKTAADFKKFLEENSQDFDQLYVKEVYNSGDSKYPESPLCLYSGYSIITLYLSGETLSLNIYDKDFFVRNIRGGIFRENPDSENFCCVNFTSSVLINSFIKELDIKERSDGFIDSINLIFKNEQQLCIKHSESSSYAMCSKVTD